MKSSFRNLTICLYFLGAIVLFSSCGKKTISIPKDVLSKEELVPILVDIHIAQAYTGMSQLNDSARLSLQDYTGYIYKIHHVTEDKYKNSMTFHSLHPELLNEIYEEVINELSKKQSEADRK
jgi:hypothetical protein